MDFLFLKKIIILLGGREMGAGAFLQSLRRQRLDELAGQHSQLSEGVNQIDQQLRQRQEQQRRQQQQRQQQIDEQERVRLQQEEQQRRQLEEQQRRQQQRQGGSGQRQRQQQQQQSSSSSSRYPYFVCLYLCIFGSLSIRI